MIGIIIVGISALLSMVIIFGAQDAFGFGKADRAIAFEVPQDATVADVAELLEEKGVVNSAFLFRVYYKFNNPEGSFHYGTYTLNSNMSYSMIITELFKYGRIPRGSFRHVPRGLYAVSDGEPSGGKRRMQRGGLYSCGG